MDNFFIIAINFLISFGPLNHSDVTQYYAGYPYQFWIQNKHFIDGGLHQGLLSVTDFANISFFQEGNTWLIRSVLGIPIIFIYFLFKIKNTSYLSSLIFFTSTVLIQFLTIGKNIFFGEAF